LAPRFTNGISTEHYSTEQRLPDRTTKLCGGEDGAATPQDVTAVRTSDLFIAMRVIFLDVDGVLVTHRFMLTDAGQKRVGKTARHPGHSRFDPSCVSAINCIVGATKASLVISSTWREFFGSNEAMRRHFALQGVDGHIVGPTPVFTDPDAQRGDEIHCWLEAVSSIVESFVILDDEDHLWPDDLRARWIQTDFETGLTTSHVRKAIQMMR